MDDTPEGPDHNDVTVPGTRSSLDDSPVVSIDRRHLLVFNGSSSWLYPLPGAGRIIIGRSETVDLRVDEASVSDQHAALVIDGDRVAIVDLGSQHGTFVNGAKITGETVVHTNDVVTIHKTTLILHTTTPPSTAAVCVEFLAFRQRLEDELDRAVRYERTFSLLCLVWPTTTADRVEIERTLAHQLRRIDLIAWSGGTTLYTLLAEASTDEATMIAARIRAKLDATTLRIGRVTCPEDGYDVDSLLARAHNAAVGAEPGTLAGTSRAFHTITIGSQRVLIADPAVARLYALVERLAPVDITVLVMGETGCGKELAATAIHTMSRRHAKRLVSLNCAAITETLVESELFGHDKGAFSGAVATKAGLLEAASGSTLFLDEVGELSPSTQAKLLRVLETRRVTRVGDVRERDVDVRIVAATNRDLDAEVAAGRFRQDLFFRLAAATLYMPPLRQRPREIPLLASAFLDEECRRTERGMMAISDAAMAALVAHSWPGNVRELKNLMQYVAAAHPTDRLTAEHITDRLRRRVTGEQRPMKPAVEAQAFRPLADEIRDLEITRMRAALEASSGNQTRAAGLLTMPVRTFFEKAKLYALTPKRKRED